MSLRRIIAFYLDCFFAMIFLWLLFIFDLFYDYNFNFDDYIFSYWGLQLISIYIYYFTCEYFFENTLGKKILNLKIVNIEETDKFKQILIRTSARFIPLDPVSFLFNKEQLLWHEVLSKTTVITNKNV